MRLDQWLWAVRVYRSRVAAVAAIKGGHVRINGLTAKPGRDVHPGEIITAQTTAVLRTLVVVANPPSRVAAARVPEFVEERTPRIETPVPRLAELGAPPRRPPGSGRPTKRERRALDRLEL